MKTMEDIPMIKAPDVFRRYNPAKQRFLKPIITNFFAREFPKLFGPVMQEKVADELIDLFESYSPETKRLKPGQLLWTALDKNTRGDSPNRRFVPVVLTVTNQEDITELSQGIPVSKITGKAIARMYKEAYEQGGILSNRDLSLITLRSTTEVSRRRIKYETENNCVLPHTGSLHDMGSTITHKTTIIKKIVKEKKDPSDVAKETNHSQRAVDNYLKDYHRVKTAYKQNQSIEFVYLVTGIAKHVVKQYLRMIRNEY